MKIAVILVIFAVLYCVAAEDAKKEPKENSQNGKSKESSEPTSTASPPRARRSPPRFDPNQTKGKYAKSKIRALLPGFGLVRAPRQERSIIDYLSPTPALIYAVNPPMDAKFPETTPSA